MIMVKNQHRIGAGEFKAKCLALLDEVASTGKILVVTKRGKPLARVVPFEEPRSLLGSVLKETDIVSPIDADWDATQ
jgi:prevent-host-death family protein